MSTVPEPNNNVKTESSEGGNVIPPTNTERKFKNPTTIEEMVEMRQQISKDKNLKRRVKVEYKRKVQIEAQGMEYAPPEDLKQFKILQPKNLRSEPSQTLLSQEDSSTNDVSAQVF